MHANPIARNMVGDIAIVSAIIREILTKLWSSQSAETEQFQDDRQQFEDHGDDG